MTASPETTAVPSVTTPVLEVAGATLRFGGLTSLNDVSMQVQRGTVSAVIGPNGAGKTSLFNCLTGAYRPQEGQIFFTDTAGTRSQLVGKKPHSIVSLGIARTFQNIRLFPALTALENVQIGVESLQRSGALSAMLHLPRSTRDDRESVEEAVRLLEFVGLEHRVHEVSAGLPYGDQRRLEIARALGTKPSLLLLDEPAAGTNPAEKRDLEELIRRVADTGVSVLLIEHDMRLVMSVATEVTVLNFGKVIAAGPPAAVQRDPAVVEAYLGSDTDADASLGAGDETDRETDR